MGPDPSRQEWQKVAVKEAGWISVMQIIKRTSTKRIASRFNKWRKHERGRRKVNQYNMLSEWMQKGGRKNMMEQHEEEGLQRQVEGWLEQTGRATGTTPKWSEVFGGKGEAQELPPSFKSPCAEPPHTTQSFKSKVEGVARRSTRYSRIGRACRLVEGHPVEQQQQKRHFQSGGVETGFVGQREMYTSAVSVKKRQSSHVRRHHHR